MADSFEGTKAALLYEDKIITLLRDDKPSIPYPNMWDLPGGGREGGESPRECVVREIREELGITLEPGAFIWERAYPSMGNPNGTSYFFVTKITTHALGNVVFGGEGQCWKLMRIDTFLTDDDVIPHLKTRLRDYLMHQKR